MHFGRELGSKTLDIVGGVVYTRKQTEDKGEHMSKVEGEIRTQGRRKGWIAAQMDLSPSLLSRLLHGRKPWTISLMESMARVLGKEVDGLFFADEIRRAESNRRLGYNRRGE